MSAAHRVACAQARLLWLRVEVLKRRGLFEFVKSAVLKYTVVICQFTACTQCIHEVGCCVTMLSAVKWAHLRVCVHTRRPLRRDSMPPWPAFYGNA